MDLAVDLPVVPVGVIKSFGPVGPKYEVRNVSRALDDGDFMIEVLLIESGERVDYRLSQLLDDPEAI